MIYTVKVKPHSRKGPLVLVDGENITVYLREKPVDGEANRALIALLAQHFHAPKTTVHIKSGLRGRQKYIEID